MPEISQFITPAVVKRDDVMIAISTSGKAPVLARNLRLKINQMLPHNLGELVEFTYNFRPISKRLIIKSKKLFSFWNEVFSPQNMSILLTKNDAKRHEFLMDMIECQKPRTGKIIEINLSSRDAEDLTLKAHRFINIADVIIYGDDMQDILNYARRDARRIFLNNEISVENLVQLYLNNGDLVVYLKPINDNPKTYKNKIVSMNIT